MTKSHLSQLVECFLEDRKRCEFIDHGAHSAICEAALPFIHDENQVIEVVLQEYEKFSRPKSSIAVFGAEW